MFFTPEKSPFAILLGLKINDRQMIIIVVKFPSLLLKRAVIPPSQLPFD